VCIPSGRTRGPLIEVRHRNFQLGTDWDN